MKIISNKKLADIPRNVFQFSEMYSILFGRRFAELQKASDRDPEATEWKRLCMEEK